jgi:hypothetical protein
VNYTDKARLVAAAHDRRNKISDQKGPEYAGSGSEYTADEADVLANFKKVGERLGLDPLTVAGVYMTKHYDSIATWIREAEGKTLEEKYASVESGEGVISRLDDLRNYADLLECLITELILWPEQEKGVLPDLFPNYYGH